MKIPCRIRQPGGCHAGVVMGFLIFLVMSWNMQNVVFTDISQEERQKTMEAMKDVAELQQGDQLNETPQTRSGSGEGYAKKGTVYQDPETGKLIMVEG